MSHIGSFSFSKLFGFGTHSNSFVPPPRITGKRTLILDLDDTLIHRSTFPPHSKVEYFKLGTPEFYVFKRPGLVPFLELATRVFETFIFTYGDRSYAEPILNEICPFIDDDHRLYRDRCSLEGESVHKDIGIFDRAETDLILVDDSRRTMKFHRKNTILIRKWQGTPLDRALIDWLPGILECCLLAKDVRTVIAGIPKEVRGTSEYVEGKTYRPMTVTLT
jgi:TFIIF-interacting CTD phosphatase-like protein